MTEKSVYTGLCHAQLYTKTAACSNLRLRALAVSTKNTGPIVLTVQITSSWHLGCYFLSFLFFFSFSFFWSSPWSYLQSLSKAVFIFMFLHKYTHACPICLTFQYYQTFLIWGHKGRWDHNLTGFFLQHLMGLKNPLKILKGNVYLQVFLALSTEFWFKWFTS